MYLMQQSRHCSISNIPCYWRTQPRACRPLHISCNIVLLHASVTVVAGATQLYTTIPLLMCVLLLSTVDIHCNHT